MSNTVFPSTRVAADTRPTSAAQLWDLTRLMMVSWDEGVTVETTWDDALLGTLTASEKRLGFTGRPRRAVRCTLKALARREAWQLLNMQRRMGIARSLFPLYPDAAQVTSVTGGRTVLHGDFSDRRFYPGARVVVGRRALTPAGYGPECDVFEVATLSTGSPPSSTLLTLTGATTATFGYGDWVWPLIEAQVSLKSSLTPYTDWNGYVQVVAQEVPGPTALPPWPPPTGFDTFTCGASYEVFDPARVGAYENQEASQVGWSRDARQAHIGIGDLYELVGARPRAARRFSLDPHDRQSTVKCLAFWDKHGGELFPFMVISPIRPMEVTAVDATHVSVKASGPVSDWADFPVLAAKVRGSPASLAAISGVVRSSGIDTITLASALSPTPSINSLLWVAPAFSARFDGATLTEEWQTTQHCHTQMDVIEVAGSIDSGGCGGETDITTGDFGCEGCDGSDDGGGGGGGGGPDGSCRLTYYVVFSSADPGEDPAGIGPFALTWVSGDLWRDPSGAIILSSGGDLVPWEVSNGYWLRSMDGAPGHCPPTGTYTEPPGDYLRQAFVS